MIETLTSSAAPTQQKSMHVPALILALAAFLLPVLIIPLPFFPVQLTKVAVALIAVVLALIAFAYHAFRTKTVSVPISLSLLALFTLPIGYLISAMFAQNPALSLWGYQLDSDSFAFLTLSSSLAAIIAIVAPHRKRILSILFGFFVAGVAVVVFSLIELFIGGRVSLALFSSPTINLVGSWNGLGIFLGLFVSLVLVGLESFPFSAFQQWLMRGVVAASLFLLVVINIKEVWVVVTFISFIALVHGLLHPGNAEHKSGIRGITAGAILVVSLFFLFFGSGIVTSLQNSFGVQVLDVRPSVSGTLSIAQSAYATNPLFGTGPNTFAADWFLYRPAEIANTPFWNVAFPSGFASIPTALATGGAVVALAWLFLITAFSYAVTKALLSKGLDNRSYFFITVSAVGSFYLLSMHSVHIADQVLTLLMFLFFGLFIAASTDAGLVKKMNISFLENPRLGFFSILIILITVIAGLVSLYGAAVVYASTLSYQKAVDVASTGDFGRAKLAITKAITLYPQDRYYRTLAAIEMANLNSIVNDTKLADSDKQTRFRETLSSAISASTRATELDPGGYYNWMSRASVYGSVVPLKIAGAYESAQTVLEAARVRNPHSPEVDFQIAELKAVENDRDGARAFAGAALKKKSDYTAAILLLAQLSLAEGNLGEAIRSVEAAVVLEPTNNQLIYQLGLLKLQNKEYAGAKEAFESALKVNPDYANAKFYLGETQVLMGDTMGGLTTFKSIKNGNEDNEILKSVIAELEAGKNPFADTKNPPTPSQ